MDADLTLDDVLYAYANGLFPMADGRNASGFFWYDPPQRGQLSIPALHIPRRLRRTLRADTYDIRTDTAFAAVIDGCAAAADNRPESWINAEIRAIFLALHEAGYAHSVECWQDGALAGGLYGLALGGAFMGESMFSVRRDASKVALVHLCARLWRGGFTILDTQYVNPHLEQFGIYEIPRAAYKKNLQQALMIDARFSWPGLDEKKLLDDYLLHNSMK